MSHRSLLLSPASLLAGAILAAAAAVAPAQTPAPAAPAVPAMPLSDDVKPIRVAGLGIRVSDLERSKKFYTEVLGLKVDAKVPAQGEPAEYLLGMTGDVRADTLIVIRKGEIKPGATEFGTITMVVPNGRKMAERVAAAGYAPDRIVDGTNFVKDPDGYTIELYQRPAARQ
ncbi:MAG TPA: VOC family protein [Candidatus Angelobacter sp.]|nr:VOC family protein [Candidatus Angelobacter sp.]